MAATRSGWMARYGPILFVQLYLNASLAVFAFGPWIWPIESPARLYLFVLSAHAALLAGYVIGIRRAPPPAYGGAGSAEVWLRRSVWLTLLLYPSTLWWLTDGQIDPIGALVDPATAYFRFQDMASADRPTTLISYVRTLVAPVLSLLMPVAAARWHALSFRWRVLAGAAIASNLSLFVFTGRNKGLVDFVLLLPWLFAVRPVRQRTTSLFAHASRAFARRIVALALVALALVGFGAFYLRGNAGRSGGADDAFRVRIFGGMDADPDNVILRPLPPLLQAAVLGLSFNQTHGYFALSLALDKPFTSSWGVGHSYFLQTLERRLTGRSTLGDRSYPARISEQDDWSASEFWHTTYTWFASDVSFPGAVVVVAAIGYLFARLWTEARRGENPFSLGLFLLVVTILYYLPTNNIVLGQPEGFGAFWGLLVARRLTWVLPPAAQRAASASDAPPIMTDEQRRLPSRG